MPSKRICVVGCGITGLATGAVFASLGHRVRIVDADKTHLSAIFGGETAAEEPDLLSLLAKGMRTKRISLSDDVEDGVESSDFIFVSPRGSKKKSEISNIPSLRDATKMIGAYCLKGKTVVFREVAWPGAIEEILAPLLEKASGLKAGKGFGLAANPAFFSRGRAVQGCMKPSSIVVGATNRSTATSVSALYLGIDSMSILTDIRTAEMIKLADSCFHATKISLVNEIANLCEKLGIDADDVMRGVSAGGIKYGRIKPGLGFGGGRLPRDLAAMIAMAESKGMKMDVLRATKKANEKQPLRAVRLLQDELGDLRGKKVAILGLAYKAGVSDTTGSSAVPLAIELMARGAKVVGYDPLAGGSFIAMLPEISFASSASEALLDADACIILTDEWEFASLNKLDFDLMRKKIVVDGRRVTSPTKLKRYGVTLKAVGLGD